MPRDTALVTDREKWETYTFDTRKHSISIRLPVHAKDFRPKWMECVPMKYVVDTRYLEGDPARFRSIRLLELLFDFSRFRSEPNFSVGVSLVQFEIRCSETPSPEVALKNYLGSYRGTIFEGRDKTKIEIINGRAFVYAADFGVRATERASECYLLPLTENYELAVTVCYPNGVNTSSSFFNSRKDVLLDIVKSLTIAPQPEDYRVPAPLPEKPSQTNAVFLVNPAPHDVTPK